MAWEKLPTDFTDAVWAGLRKYLQVNNEDGTVSFQDVTTYSNKEKSFFGAKNANRMNEAMNVIMAMLENGTDLYGLFQDYFTEQKRLFGEKADDEFASFSAYVTDLKEQGDERIESIETEYGQDIENFKERQEELFSVWFQGVRKKLEGDIAAKLSSDVEFLKTSKQDNISGTKGQIVGFDEKGKPVAQEPPDTGVVSFNGRKGEVRPQSGDYTAADVGARPSSWTPTAVDVGAVPTTRKVNGKALSDDISLTAADVGARPSSWTPAIELNDIIPKNAGAHNSIYRGKYLGDSYTAEQQAAVAAGTFEDLYIGDYWVIDGVNWRIAAFDYYYRTGDTECTTHHVVIVPDTNLYNAQMNPSNTTEGGYVGSKMYTENLAQAVTKIEAAFGSAHILTRRDYLVYGVTDGKPSNSSVYDVRVCIMTEQNVYGGKFYGTACDGTTLLAFYTIDKSQFPLFAHNPYMISNRQTFWLRDVVSASAFARVLNNGCATAGNASDSRGVRPAFSIKS